MTDKMPRFWSTTGTELCPVFEAAHQVQQSKNKAKNPGKLADIRRYYELQNQHFRSNIEAWVENRVIGFHIKSMDVLRPYSSCPTRRQLSCYKSEQKHAL